MSIVEYSIRHRSVMWFVLGLFIVGGVWSFMSMGKKEDSTFVLKTAVVTCSYPGATPLQVEQLISEPVARELQSMRGVHKITSESYYGYSKITVELNPATRADEIPQLWDARILRRDETSFAAMPRLEFRYYERSGVLCGRRRGYARTPHRGEHKNLKQKSHVYKIFIRVSKAAQPQGRRATCKISKFSDITHPICGFYPNRPSAGSESRTTETAHR